MPIQRTKEQKRKAQAKRAELHPEAKGASFTFTASVEGTQVAVGKELIPEQQKSFIQKDLLRTVLVSVILFGALVGIYIYLGYN